MTRITLILAATLALAGCDTLGGIAYCPPKLNCSFQQMPPVKFEITPAAPAPAASGVSA